MSITIEAAVTLALSRSKALPCQEVPLQQALGRILAKPLYARFDQPPFDRSPLDGYAVWAEETVDASKAHPVTLKVVDKLYAGQLPQVSLRPGQAVRIMTGAMLPQGATGVIRQEDTDEGENSVTIFKGVRPGSNCCRRGEEYSEGDLLLPAGVRIDAAAIAVAASAGYASLPVFRKVRAAVLSTGDELLQPGQSLVPGKIFNSNTAYLIARLTQLNVDIVRTAYAGDDLPAIAQALDCCRDCDLILTTGGVSVGQKDLLEASLQHLEAEIVFHGIAIKPGMPTLMAMLGNAIVLGLSGNPFSAAVPFELLVRPILSKMVQDPGLVPEQATGIAANGFAKTSPKRRYLRANVCGNRVTMPTAQSNGQMRSMVGCNCLIDIPAGSGVIHPGDPVSIIRL